jgi:hypothetical protein
VPRAVHVGFVLDKVALGLFFSESFGFPMSVSFHRCSIFTHVSSGKWTKGPLAAHFHRDGLNQSQQIMCGIYWVERKVLAFSKRWPFFEALSYM